MSSPVIAVPPLAAGQRLTREEFERRYEAMKDLKKAELIEGVVHVPSPIRFLQHTEPLAVLIHWLMTYRLATPGVRTGGEATVRLDPQNEPQPDAVLFIEPDCGGQARIDADGYLEGAPELMTQVAASTTALDLGPRLEAYRRNGVNEYPVWRVADQELDWFVQRAGLYERLPLSEGVYRSERFPGLWLDAAALLRGDLAAVVRTLQAGIASPEHAAFVAGLAGRRAAPHGRQ
jgi:Putative restriction endonuclease